MGKRGALARPSPGSVVFRSGSFSSFGLLRGLRLRISPPLEKTMWAHMHLGYCTLAV